jgi:hypothetical protein
MPVPLPLEAAELRRALVWGLVSADYGWLARVGRVRIEGFSDPLQRERMA